MKRDQIKELHQKTLSELQTQLTELEREIALAKLKAQAGKLEDTSSIGLMGDDVARIKTVMSEIRAKQAQEEQENKGN